MLQGLLRGRRGDRPPQGGAGGAQREGLRRRGQDRVRRRRLLPPRTFPQGMSSHSVAQGEFSFENHESLPKL